MSEVSELRKAHTQQLDTRFDELGKGSSSEGVRINIGRYKEVAFKFDEMIPLKDDSSFDAFKGLDYWRWDLTKEEHIELYHKTGGRCCFNHLIGLPVKKSTPPRRLPIFDYQKEPHDKLYSNLERGGEEDEQNYHAILKATGMGASTGFLRELGCLTTRDNKLSGYRIGIITGIREATAHLLLDRFMLQFAKFPKLPIERIKNKIVINGCIIESFPAKNFDALRSYDDLKVILVDEADLFLPSQQKDVLTTIERYEAKSAPSVWLISTPRQPYGIMYHILTAPKGHQKYDIIKWHWKVGLGKIFTKQEIDKQKKDSENFEQEYGLQFKGTTGNFISSEAILGNIISNNMAEKIGYKYYLHYEDIINDSNYNYNIFRNQYPKIMSIDPAVGESKGASMTGVSISQVRNNKIELIYGDVIITRNLAKFSKIVAIMVPKMNIKKVLVDAGFYALVNPLKDDLSDNILKDYEDQEWKTIEEKIKYSKMIVCPIPFQGRRKMMYQKLKRYTENNRFLYCELQDKITVALKSAWFENGEYDKEKSANDDLFDSLAMQVFGYDLYDDYP